MAFIQNDNCLNTLFIMYYVQDIYDNYKFFKILFVNFIRIKLTNYDNVI